MRFQASLESFGGPRSMGVGCFPPVAELRDRPSLALRDEDRVEAEPARAARLVDDPALEDARSPPLLARGRNCDQLADVARPARRSLHALELGEQPLDVLPGSEPRRLDPGPPAEA
jgi:hypothetical protein